MPIDYFNVRSIHDIYWQTINETEKVINLQEHFEGKETINEQGGIIGVNKATIPAVSSEALSSKTVVVLT